MNREINKLWWHVFENLRSGRLSLDTIDRVLFDADDHNVTLEQSLGQRAEALDAIRKRVDEQLRKQT